MVVFDASASMAEAGRSGRAPRIAVARAALAEVLPEASAHRRIGLVAYGPGGGCDGVSLRLAPRADAAGAILSEIDALSPEGRTALTRAVRLASGALGGTGTVVLVTDGEETCAGRPCELAARLAERAPGLTVHVIGFRMRDTYPPPGFERGGPGANARPASAQCLARRTGGLSLTARTVKELVAALRRTLGCGLLF